MAMNGKSTKLINTDDFSAYLRSKGIDLREHRILITNYQGTDQEEDLSEPPNCNGFGRIRHFSRCTSDGWPENPLPIDPACRALGLPELDGLRAQAFQNAVCNWRCWYCYVPFSLLSANQTASGWLEPSTLIDLYQEQQNPPPVIDLTGGQPDLVPEWVPWIMTELRARGLDRAVYLWSDDNLSNDYFWRYLSNSDQELVATYPNYGRVCCFKGLNEQSFSFNTRAEPILYNRQFELIGRLLTTGIDLYGYITLTTPSHTGISDDVSILFDRLQNLCETLPLRIIPLEVQVYTPVIPRLDETMKESLKNQWLAVEAWQNEMQKRFSSEQLALKISSVHLSRSIKI